MPSDCGRCSNGEGRRDPAEPFPSRGGPRARRSVAEGVSGVTEGRFHPESTGLAREGATSAIGWALAVLVAISTLGQGGDHPSVMTAVHVGVAALVVAVVLVRAAGCGGAARVPDPKVLAAWFAWLAVVAVGAARAPYRWAAIEGLSELAVVTGVAWLAARCGPDLLRRLAGPLLAIGAAHAGWVLVQRLVLDEHRPAGTFFNTNHLAAWLGAVVWIAAPSWLGAHGRRGRPFAVAALVIVAAGWLSTGSRGALLGAAAGAAIWVFLRAPRVGARFPRGVAIAAIAAAVVVAAVAIELARRASPDPFRYQRVAIWRASLDVASDRAAFGIGPRQFSAMSRATQFPDDEPPLRFDRTFSSTHSDVLRLPVETGLVGTVLAAIVVGMVAAVAWGRIRADGRSPTRPPETVAACAAIGALAVQAGVENLSHRPAVYLLAALAVGALVSRVRTRPETAPSRILALACAGAVATAAAFDVTTYASWRSWVASRTDVERAVEHLDRAVARNPLHAPARIDLAEAHAAGGSLDDWAAAMRHAERAYALSPHDARIAQRFARLEARACVDRFRDAACRSRALARFEEAGRLHPTNPLIALEECDWRIRLGDPAGALDAAEHAARLEPEAPVPYVFRARALVAAIGSSPRTDSVGAGTSSGTATADARDALGRAAALARARTGTVLENDYARALFSIDPDAVRELYERLDALDEDAGGETSTVAAANAAPEGVRHSITVAERTTP